jgi:hypothetical protein
MKLKQARLKAAKRGARTADALRFRRVGLCNVLFEDCSVFTHVDFLDAGTQSRDTTGIFTIAGECDRGHH